MVDMGKESGPQRARSKDLQSPTGHKASPDSGPIRETGGSGRVYVNERGETCYGTKCFTLAVDTQRREIRVNIKQSDECELDMFLEAMRETLGKGARTVYEVESEYREDKR